MSPGMPQACNYYRWIFSKFEKDIGDNVLDIGGGYGAHLEPMMAEGRKITSIDISQASVDHMNRKFCLNHEFSAICIDFMSAEFIEKLSDMEFDTVTCINVMEHIDDDVFALEAMRRVLEQKRGSLLLMVPAHSWLYGSMDREAGHFRRYSRRYLKVKLEKAGFVVKSLTYFNAFGVIPWFINNRLLKKRLADNSVDYQIRFFDSMIVPWSRKVEELVSFPCGQSLVAVARPCFE